MLKDFKQYGISTSDILLPNKSVDLSKWAVVACDQYTSELDYWNRVKETIKDSPSTLNLIYPEVFLEIEDNSLRIEKINKAMEEYLNNNIFTVYKDCFILVERTTVSGTRYGLMASLDLEQYSYAVDSKSLIRATEGTILSRIPPRKEIRKNASLELPHIMVLISDAKKQIIEPLVADKANKECIYNVNLMENGGILKGYLINSEADLNNILAGFKNLYDALNPENPLLFAMGDGNHSLATAKSCWEDIKKNISDEEAINHKARYALVELENIFDPALLFEAIHRVFFKLDEEKLMTKLSKIVEVKKVVDCADLNSLNESIIKEGASCFGFITKDKYQLYCINNLKSSTTAGSFQVIIDELVKENVEIDYIHGTDVVEKLAKDNNIGIILPDISKETFFASIEKDASFPRKTFSIGHAEEKRFYMEAKLIK